MQANASCEGPDRKPRQEFETAPEHALADEDGILKASAVSSIRHSRSTSHQASDVFITMGRVPILSCLKSIPPSRSAGIPAAAGGAVD